MEAAGLSLLIVVAAVALFDFSNGFHDAADRVAGTTLVDMSHILEDMAIKVI